MSIPIASNDHPIYNQRIGMETSPGLIREPQKSPIGGIYSVDVAVKTTDIGNTIYYSW